MMKAMISKITSQSDVHGNNCESHSVICPCTCNVQEHCSRSFHKAGYNGEKCWNESVTCKLRVEIITINNELWLSPTIVVFV